MTAGYSGTPLIKKLGIKEEMKVFLLYAPADYYKWMEKDISLQVCSNILNADFIHLFAKDAAVFFKVMEKIKNAAGKNTSIIIWVSWYKKSAGIKTDLTEDVIRNYALANNLVDVKVCAVSNEWSGLKLVVPLAKR